LGEEEIKLTKRNYGWPEEAKFLVPDDVRERFHEAMGKRGLSQRREWLKKFDDLQNQVPGAS
jgi:transketolase